MWQGARVFSFSLIVVFVKLMIPFHAPYITIDDELSSQNPAEHMFAVAMVKQNYPGCVEWIAFH